MKRKDGLTCTGTSKQTKERCGNPPIPGCTVCKFHGGAAPQVKAAGVRRMMEDLLGPAMVEIARIIQEPGVSDNVKATVIRDLLDRTGHKPATQVEMMPTLEQVARWQSLVDDE